MLKNRLSKLSDTELVDAVIRGDESAIKYFFYEKYIPLFKIIYYKVASNRRVPFEDLLQELFIHFCKNDWEKLKKYDESCGKLNAWLSTVVYNLFDDKSSSMIDSAPHDPIDDMDCDRQFADWASQIDGKLLVEDVMKLLDLLHPPRYKTVLIEVRVKLRSIEEVAKELKITKANLSNILSRAKQQFDLLYEKFYGEKYKD